MESVQICQASLLIRAANRAKCANNLKQLGIAVHHYTTVNEGQLPAARTQENGGDRWWFGATQPGSALGVTSRVPTGVASVSDVTWEAKLPSAWWFLPCTSAAMAPPTETDRVPGETGTNQPRGTSPRRIASSSSRRAWVTVDLPS